MGNYKRKGQHIQQTKSNIDGNVIRKPRNQPQRQTLQRRTVSRSAKKALVKQKRILVMLGVVGAITTVFLCLLMLYTRDLNMKLTNAVTEEEDQLFEMRKANDERENSMDRITNLDEIIYIATHELGMQRPYDEQIVRFQAKEKEYIKQTAPIPKVSP